MIRAASHDIFYLNKKPEASEPQPWKGRCNSRCYVAKTDKKKCKCKCRGEHHGKRLTNRQQESKIDEYCNQV